MAEYQFELTPFFEKKRRGRRGVVAAFGELTVTAVRKKPGLKSGHKQLEVQVLGDRIPEIVYQTVGPGRPTLRNARLRIDGNPAKLTFNTKAFRNASRALHITCERERSYEYVAARLGMGGTLTRPGVLVSLTRDKNPTGKGMSSFGTVTGEADALDVALAVLFEEVETLELTASGAVSGVVQRILYSGSNEPYEGI
ncbi:hypothetical protein ACGFZS_35345 [Streptomyces sp. NPDC048288]|uniref:hypothetical protein n=1 Tax=Streptomyces sp. NPDC048288 TaxID=3365529 RepID=UPI00372029B2